MNNEKPVQLDEKTSKLIEEMDKSLANMEQSLGAEHIVIAKLLDSYARLLRQNNIRPLDALNMEARARAIRAKHNQKEAEEQERGLETAEYQSGVSAGKARIIVWSLAAIVCLSLGGGLLQLFKWSAQKTATKYRTKIRDTPEIPAGSNQNSSQNELTFKDSYASRELGTEVRNESLPGQGQGQGQEQEQEQKQEQENVEGNKVTVLEYAEHMLKLKRLAKEQLTLAEEAEKEKDFPKASQCYESVIRAVEQDGMGRIPVCEEIAACYEGYGRMAELDAHPEITSQCNERAQEIRAMLNKK